MCNESSSACNESKDQASIRFLSFVLPVPLHSALYRDNNGSRDISKARCEKQLKKKPASDTKVTTSVCEECEEWNLITKQFGCKELSLPCGAHEI